MNTANFVGIPFKSFQKDFDGCDCYGLVQLYYQEMLGIIIPDFKILATNSIAVDQAATTAVNSYWSKIQTPELHCGVLMADDLKHPNLIQHFGIVVENDKLLHTTYKTGSIIVPLKNDLNHIKGFVKWLP